MWSSEMWRQSKEGRCDGDGGGRSENISLIRCLWEVMWRKRGRSCHMESWGSSSHAEEEQVQSPYRGSMHGTKEALQGATDSRASEERGEYGRKVRSHESLQGLVRPRQIQGNCGLILGTTTTLWYWCVSRCHLLEYSLVVWNSLLLLSCFSCVQPCATPQMAAHQALASLGFSRQEHWSGLPFPSPAHESEKWKWSCSVVFDPLQPHGLQPTRLLHP